MMIGIIIAIVVIILLWGLTAYNKLVKLNIGCDEAFSTMDVYLKKRFDLIPNLVATVKGYAKHETETLEKVISARNSGDSKTKEQQMSEENAITQSLRQIFALSEAYPDLKANQNFIQLSTELKSVENDIANARKYYNGTIKQYNQATLVVPSNFIAKMAGFGSRPMFEVDEVAERKNVKVEL